MTQKKAPLPTMDEIVTFLNANEGKVGKREIARAFHVKGDDRIGLKKMLSELKVSGRIEKSSGKKVISADGLPEMCPCEITGSDSDGELVARPLQWTKPYSAPQILITDLGKLRPVPKEGDLVVLKLSPAGKKLFHGSVVRRLSAKPNRIVGVYDTLSGKGGRILSVDRRLHLEYFVERTHTNDAKNGDLVLAEALGSALHSGAKGSRKAKIIQTLGNALAPKAASLIAIHLHGIPTVFSDDALKLAQKAKTPSIAHRTDLRKIPLVTVDGEDARDFDDAVFVQPDEDLDNQGGFHIIVAIADVSAFVTPYDALDNAARERGNSVYFPDRVVPMLPDELSGNLCSLMPDQDRAAMVAHLWINKHGKLIRHKFERSMMRSVARLNYFEVQNVFEGKMPEMHSDLRHHILCLKDAFKVLEKAREKRGALEIDAPEREINLSSEGKITSISLRERLDSHKMIEEFMILANVAAAQTLEDLDMPTMYRVHEPPSAEKFVALQTFLNSLDIKTIKRDRPQTDDFNKILDQVKDSSKSYMVNELVLRTQSQARYSIENFGHFGLALEKYAHFTSPIRRYADLLVHRALITGLKLGDNGLGEGENLEDIADHISATERRASAAERDAEERYLSAYLADKIGQKFSGTINGVTRVGLFIVIDDVRADGLIPISTLPDYFVYEEDQHRLFGSSTGLTFELGQRVEVLLAEATPITGGLLFHLLDAGQRKRRPSSKEKTKNKPKKAYKKRK